MNEKDRHERMRRAAAIVRELHTAAALDMARGDLGSALARLVEANLELSAAPKPRLYERAEARLRGVRRG